MQSALFAALPQVRRSESAALIRLYFPSLFQALFTRPAPLTSSSPSYHSSAGDETGFRELHGEGNHRQTGIVRLKSSCPSPHWQEKIEEANPTYGQFVTDDI